MNQSPEAAEAQAELQAERAHADAMRAVTVLAHQKAAERLAAQAFVLNAAGFAILLGVAIAAAAVIVRVIL